MSHMIMRHIEIDAGHRVPEHSSKCRNLHGHRYRVEAHVLGEDLCSQGSEEGMVMDFGFLKEELMSVHDLADHALMIKFNDPLLETLHPDLSVDVNKAFADLDKKDLEREYVWDNTLSHRGLTLYVLFCTPTAENLARHWFLLMDDRIGIRSNGRAKLHKVRVWETPNCYAEYPAS